jgi:hypothetical protein
VFKNNDNIPANKKIELTTKAEPIFVEYKGFQAAFVAAHFAQQ